MFLSPVSRGRRGSTQGCRGHRKGIGILRPEGQELLKKGQEERLAYMQASSGTLRQALGCSSPIQVPATWHRISILGSIYHNWLCSQGQSPLSLNLSLWPVKQP